MCDYCDTNSESWKYRAHCFSLGVLGDYELDTSISQKYGLQLTLRHKDSGNEITHINDQQVKFCPYCGEQLKGDLYG